MRRKWKKNVMVITRTDWASQLTVSLWGRFVQYQVLLYSSLCFCLMWYTFLFWSSTYLINVVHIFNYFPTSFIYFFHLLLIILITHFFCLIFFFQLVFWETFLRSSPLKLTFYSYFTFFYKPTNKKMVLWEFVFFLFEYAKSPPLDPQDLQIQGYKPIGGFEDGWVYVGPLASELKAQLYGPHLTNLLTYLLFFNKFNFKNHKFMYETVAL